MLRYLLKLHLITFIIYIFSTHYSFGQEVTKYPQFDISGTVSDLKGVTLSGATVFLSGTKMITSTDKNGKYIFKDLPTGTYLIVVRFLGFENANASIDLINEPLIKNFKLKEQAGQLQQVVITGDRHWEERFQEFKKRFLGLTPNAEYCQILNKDILHFKIDKDKVTLTASAEDFLEIINNGLGYKIKYLLETFKFNPNTGMLFYSGYPSFQELSPKDKKQEKLWKANRYKAYSGSINHLMKSLYENDTMDQGFRLYSSDYDPNSPLDEQGNEKKITINSKLIIPDSIAKTGDDNFKILSFDGSIFVVYVNDRETFNYRNSGYMLRRPYGSNVASGEYSMFSMMDNNISIDAQGNYSPPNGLAFKGHMAWEQIAELTPLDGKIEKPQ